MDDLLRHIVPNLLLWGIVVSGVFLRGNRRPVRALAVILALAAIPIGPQLALAPLTTIGRVETEPPTGTSFVAVFGAGAISLPAIGPWPATDTVRRLSAGLIHARRSGLPVAFSGGDAMGHAVTEAEAILARISLPAGTYIDDKARNTAENAAAFAGFAERSGYTHVVVATAPEHLRRASAVLRSHDLVVAAAAQFPMNRQLTPYSFVPSVKGLVAWAGPVYEWTALAWYLIDDRIRFRDL